MANHNQSDIVLFSEAAGKISNRLYLVSWFRWIWRSGWMIGVFAIIMVLALRLIWQWRSGECLVVAALLLVWLGLGAVAALVARPDLERSLARLDETCDEQD